MAGATQSHTLETTSGLPDDSREEDERRAERHLRDLRGRVKAARAAVAATPRAEEVLRRDWIRAARFYARFGITEAMFRHGVPADYGGPGESSPNYFWNSHGADASRNDDIGPR